MLGIKPENVERLGRLQPGKLFLVDLEQGRIVEDEEVKHAVSTQQPYGEWFDRNCVHFSDLEPAQSTLTGVLPGHERAPRLRLLAGGPARPDRADGARRRGADRLDGQRQRARRAVRPAPAALRVLQAALRAGHEPADRPDPRVDRHVARHGRRLRGQPARRDARARPPAGRWTSRSCATTSWRRCATSITTSSRRYTIDITWPVDEGAAGHERARSTDACDEAHDAIDGRRQHHDPVRPRRRPGPRADPVAARRRAPCTITSSARATACGRASCSSPASRARSITSRR